MTARRWVIRVVLDQSDLDGKSRLLRAEFVYGLHAVGLIEVHSDHHEGPRLVFDILHPGQTRESAEAGAACLSAQGWNTVAAPQWLGDGPRPS